MSYSINLNKEKEMELAKNGETIISQDNVYYKIETLAHDNYGAMNMETEEESAIKYGNAIHNILNRYAETCKRNCHKHPNNVWKGHRVTPDVDESDLETDFEDDYVNFNCDCDGYIHINELKKNRRKKEIDTSNMLSIKILW